MNSQKRIAEAAQTTFEWLDKRLFLQKLFNATAGHKVPKTSGSWWYVFGSATLLCFCIQIVTGILLALVYVPSGAEAYTTLLYLNFQQPLGWFIRAMHSYGSNLMVLFMCIHMTQVFLFGAYKYPRELTWISGIFLLVFTLGMSFTGQILRFDEDAYWGLGIGASIMGRVPFFGQELVNIMLGGPIIAGDTLSRFFSLHVFVLPGLILAVISLHLRLVLKKGINEYPEPGKLVRRETYDADYEKIIEKDGVPFVPKAVSKDLIFSAFVLFLIIFCAAIFGPTGPKGPPDPLNINAVPRPDLPFLWIFAVAALLPPYMETVVLLVGPAVIGVILLALPFIDNVGEKSAVRRPFAVLVTILVWLALLTLTYLGQTSDWSPQMQAWGNDITPEKYLDDRSALELRGNLVLQYKQCRNCHAIDGIGGKRGPDLAGVGTRLTIPQLTRQLLQGGGNMPAYGHNLTPAETSAVVAYLASLTPEGVPAALDSTFPARPPKESEKNASTQK
ncbi:MAG: cytochrome b N-terminal domain-containing protein [Chthoniobacterales bacterium]